MSDLNNETGQQPEGAEGLEQAIQAEANLDASSEGAIGQEPEPAAEGLAEGDGAAEETVAADLDAKAVEVEDPAADELAADDSVAGEPAAEAPEKKAASEPAIGIGHLVAVGILSLILGVLLTLPFMLGSAGQGSSGHDLSGGVAATVNGVSIGENEVTDYIQVFRGQYGVADADTWAQWLVDNDYTPDSVRSQVIETFVANELVNQEAARRGIQVSDEELDAAIAEDMEYYGGEDGLAEAVNAAGMTMDEYRADIRQSLLSQALGEDLSGDSEVTDDQVLEVLQMYGMVDEDVTSLDDVDAETVDSVKSMLESSGSYGAYEAWLEEARESADVQVNAMPETLPYAVDISGVQPSEEADADYIDEDDVYLDDDDVEIEYEEDADEAQDEAE